MKEAVATVTIQEQFAGSGALAIAEDLIPVVFFTARRDKYDVHAPWRFVGQVENPRAFEVQLLRPEVTGIAFKGFDERGRPVSMPDLDRWSFSGREFSAVGREASFGDEILEVPVKSQFVRVELWPTPLAPPEVSYSSERRWTGEIRYSRESKANRPPKHIIPFAAADLRFAENFNFEEVAVTGTQGPLLLRTSVLSGKLKKPQQTNQVGQLVNRLTDEVEDLCRLLTFLSRRHVRWHRATVITGVKPGGIHTYERVRGTRSTATAGEKRAPLLARRLMPGDALSRLLETYKSLPHKQAVSAAIVQLIAARDNAFIDARFAMAFTGFEAALQAVPDAAEFNLTASAFRQLQTKLRAVLDEYGTERQWPPATVNAIKDKLSELRRRPIVLRAAECILSLGLSWQDLWPNDSNLEDALKRAYKQRNGLVHSGHLDDFNLASLNARRILIMAERLIFRLLDGDPAWFAPEVREEVYALARWAHREAEGHSIDA